MPQAAFVSVFDHCFDIAVVGQGYAGYAAAFELARQGKDVLLVGEHGDLLWESGRSFHPFAGHAQHPLWQTLLDSLQTRGGLLPSTQASDDASSSDHGPWLDGAMAEAYASDQLMRQGVNALYYAVPLAVELGASDRPADQKNAAITSLIVATKAGRKRIVATQWIDATETGVLTKLSLQASTSGHTLSPRQADFCTANLYLQHADWASMPGASDLLSTAWPTEKILRFELPGTTANATDSSWRLQIPSVLKKLADQLGEQIGQVSMSHLSIRPYPHYNASPATSIADQPCNLAIASPSLTHGPVHTLAARFTLGIDAVDALARQSSAHIPSGLHDEPWPEFVPVQIIEAQVAVAGAGTGGALAAIAASRVLASSDKAATKQKTNCSPVVCIEPMSYLGGIGTAGGIHAYYWGVPGGMQREIDKRTKSLMQQFETPLGQGPLGDGPFNPWAKMILLQQLCDEAKINLHTDALLFDVHTDGCRISAALIATPQGIKQINASAWIDGTGDGDLCALAGAQFQLGRQHDGLLHAYSQSVGGLRELHDRPRMRIINRDAGFCDPTDPQDLTRARIEGIAQHLINQQDNFSRVTYIAPAIGLRQARQIITRYTLTLDDQIMRRTFKDTIGPSGSHYDNHATDLEFESDEALFWVWGNRMFMTQYAHDMPYGIIVPQGLDNVWIASRCLGVSQDAHHSCRMQRDIQRVGEAAGYAAALAVLKNVSAGDVPYLQLHDLLDATGSFDRAPINTTAPFGKEAGDEMLALPDELASAEQALAILKRGQNGTGLWWLFKHPQHARQAVFELLDHDGGNGDVSWFAACIAAMWGSPEAEPRLLKAITTREYGFPAEVEGRKEKTPLHNNRIVPNWLCAAALLRCCGTSACLPVLADLVNEPVHASNTLTTIALTLGRLAERLESTASHTPTQSMQSQVDAMLDRMLQTPLVGVLDVPGRSIGRLAQLAIAGEFANHTQGSITPSMPATGDSAMGNTIQDNAWQVQVAIATARANWQLPMHASAKDCLNDPRSFVRHAITKAMRGSPMVQNVQ